MSGRTIELECGKHGTVLVVASQPDDEIEEVALRAPLEKIRLTFDQVSSTILTCCRAFRDVAEGLAEERGPVGRPTRAQFSFGVSLEAGAAAVAHASTAAHFEVSFEWSFADQ